MADTFTRVSAQQQAAAYRVQLTDGAGHTWFADEPAVRGGGDTAPTPSHMLLAALGACTAITLRMYAARKGWPLHDVQVGLALNPQGRPATGNDIMRTLRLVGDLSDEQRARLMQVADACPVHRLLTGEVRITTTPS